MVVADGMGGAAAGERASALAVESVEAFALNTLKWFLHLGRAEESELARRAPQGLEIADRAVVDEAEANARLYGMGTTLTMAYSVGRRPLHRPRGRLAGLSLSRRQARADHQRPYAGPAPGLRRGPLGRGRQDPRPAERRDQRHRRPERRGPRRDPQGSDRATATSCCSAPTA